MLTEQQLFFIAPNATWKSVETFAPYLQLSMYRWNIDTFYRVASFIAQLAHESGSFKYVREIASGSAYEGRKDLGNINPGDGVKFKGRGLIQLTGRSNYRWCSKEIFGDYRLEANPDLLATPQFAVESACWFWASHGLNPLADKLDQPTPELEQKAFDRISIRINGGRNGQDERRRLYLNAKTVLIETNLGHYKTPPKSLT